MPLTDAEIRNAKPREKPYKLFDGGGLYLILMPAGGRWWRFDYRYDRKRRTISLGIYPRVSLKQARAKRDDARKKVANGIDPGEARRAARRAGDWKLLQSFLR
jgi:hypothetical protein